MCKNFEHCLKRGGEIWVKKWETNSCGNKFTKKNIGVVPTPISTVEEPQTPNSEQHGKGLLTFFLKKEATFGGEFQRPGYVQNANNFLALARANHGYPFAGENSGHIHTQAMRQLKRQKKM